MKRTLTRRIAPTADNASPKAFAAAAIPDHLEWLVTVPQFLTKGIPALLDNRKVRRVLLDPNGTELVAAYSRIVLLARHCEVPGCLVDRDGIMSFEDLAIATGLGAELIEDAVDRLSKTKGAEAELHLIDQHLVRVAGGRFNFPEEFNSELATQIRKTFEQGRSLVAL